MTDSQSLSLRLKTHANSELLIIGVILTLAAFTRLYQLGSFPYFPPQLPWGGDHSQSLCPAGMSGVYPGLYRDEMSRLCEIAFFPQSLTTYEPSIQIVFEKVSQWLLGSNYFADRLPSALASILTAVLIFLVAKQLYKSKTSALVSSLYFIAMVPALIYGRMIFYENLAGLFLVAMILCIAKFEEGEGRQWLYLGAVASLLAVISKVDALFVPVFFTIWALTRRGRREKLVPLVLVWAPMVVAGAVILRLIGSVNSLLNQWDFGFVGRELAFNFMVIQTLPSAFDVVAGGYFRPEFWYLFSYLCLALLIMAGSGWGRLFLEVLVVFFVVNISVLGMGSYYLITVFPIMALAVGGGLKSITKLGSTGSIALYGAFYAPLVASFIASIGVPNFVADYPLALLKVTLFVVPLVAWLLLEGTSRFTLKRRFPFAVVVLVCFLTLLLLATPELYSYYFLGKPLS
jgi:4-amino-4-deoxy-L-arabinose transferase-like glycosyltransferase